MRISIIIPALLLSILTTAQVVPYNLVPDWISTPNGQIATGLGLADINGDGYKDLVVANGNDIQRQRLAVHYNQGNGNFNLSPDWQSADIDYHGHLACGDLDNDGDIDVVVSVYIGPAGFSEPGELKVYYNQGNQLEANPSFVSDPFYTFSCALGDADADGDLDIASVAGEPYGGLLDYGKIFLNDNGAFQPASEWESSILMGSLDVEFGDFNRDGFMDVIFVCEGTPNVIYLAGENGVIDEGPDWQSEEVINYINSVDVGYVGSQSIVVMTENNQLGGNGQVRKYDFGNPFPSSSAASWYSNNFGYGSGIVLNDVDLDNNPDLIYGGWWLPVKIALGDGTGFEMNTSYTSNTNSVVEAILLADLDKVDVEVLQETFQVSSSQANTNMIVLEKQVLEGILEVWRNGEIVPAQNYKHVPGKPWVIFSDPLQTAESVEVSYYFSPYPDMAVTNWDSNKGDYIFYNTESSVGTEEHGDMGAWKPCGLKVWPVPARDWVRFSNQQSAVSGQQSLGNGYPVLGRHGTWKIEIYNTSGCLINSVIWPEGKNEIEINVETMQPGFYLVFLKGESGIINWGKIIIID